MPRRSSNECTVSSVFSRFRPGSKPTPQFVEVDAHAPYSRLQLQHVLPRPLRPHLFGLFHPHPVPSEILVFQRPPDVDNPFRPQQIMLDPLKPKSLVGLKKCLAAFLADGHLMNLLKQIGRASRRE